MDWGGGVIMLAVEETDKFEFNPFFSRESVRPIPIYLCEDRHISPYLLIVGATTVR